MDQNKTSNKEPFIPLSKQSKQKQKAYHTSKRTTWGTLNPVTRKPPNPKAYKRKKSGKPIDDLLPDFLFKYNLMFCTSQYTPLKVVRIFNIF